MNVSVNESVRNIFRYRKIQMQTQRINFGTKIPVGNSLCKHFEKMNCEKWGRITLG